MTHPLFKKEIFVETAFARRFQKMLQDAWDNRSWHLLVFVNDIGAHPQIK